MVQIQDVNIPLVEIFDQVVQQKNSRLFVLREDLIHPEISGNKWRKLKYNIQEAKQLDKDTILTYGGAYSNHIAATAAAGRHFGLKTVGVIRGEETLPLNPTLTLAKENGMRFKYISRIQYREGNKYKESFIKSLKSEFGDFYLVPEGGSNSLAVKGCTEILTNIKINFDVACCACGTGGTIAGIIASTKKQVLGFSVLKNASFLNQDIKSLLKQYSPNADFTNWHLNLDYHFGGYAKINGQLVDFVKQFKSKHNVQLDLIYTGKMLFGIYDILLNSTELDGKTIVAIHTGGVQGNKGFEQRLGFVL